MKRDGNLKCHNKKQVYQDPPVWLQMSLASILQTPKCTLLVGNGKPHTLAFIP